MSSKSMDKFQASLFNNPNENLIGVFVCSLSKNVRSVSGTLFVTDSRLVFHVTARLSKKTETVIHLKEVSHIVKKRTVIGEAISVCLHSGKKYTFGSFDIPRKDVLNILSSVADVDEDTEEFSAGPSTSSAPPVNVEVPKTPDAKKGSGFFRRPHSKHKRTNSKSNFLPIPGDLEAVSAPAAEAPAIVSSAKTLSPRESETSLAGDDVTSSHKDRFGSLKLNKRLSGYFDVRGMGSPAKDKGKEREKEEKEEREERARDEKERNKEERRQEKEEKRLRRLSSEEGRPNGVVPDDDDGRKQKSRFRDNFSVSTLSRSRRRSSSNVSGAPPQINIHSASASSGNLSANTSGNNSGANTPQSSGSSNDSGESAVRGRTVSVSACDEQHLRFTGDEHVIEAQLEAETSGNSSEEVVAHTHRIASAPNSMRRSLTEGMRTFIKNTVKRVDAEVDPIPCLSPTAPPPAWAATVTAERSDSSPPVLVLPIVDHHSPGGSSGADSSSPPSSPKTTKRRSKSSPMSKRKDSKPLSVDIDNPTWSLPKSVAVRPPTSDESVSPPVTPPAWDLSPKGTTPTLEVTGVGVSPPRQGIDERSDKWGRGTKDSSRSRRIGNLLRLKVRPASSDAKLGDSDADDQLGLSESASDGSEGENVTRKSSWGARKKSNPVSMAEIDEDTGEGEDSSRPPIPPMKKKSLSFSIQKGLKRVNAPAQSKLRAFPSGDRYHHAVNAREDTTGLLTRRINDKDDEYNKLRTDLKAKTDELAPNSGGTAKTTKRRIKRHLSRMSTLQPSRNDLRHSSVEGDRTFSPQGEIFIALYDLRVGVLAARDLNASDGNDNAPSTFFVITIEGDGEKEPIFSNKTKVFEKSRSPRWNWMEAFRLYWDWAYLVRIVVWQRRTPSHHLIGQVTIPLQTENHQSVAPLDEWLPLYRPSDTEAQPQGFVRVILDTEILSNYKEDIYDSMMMSTPGGFMPGRTGGGEGEWERLWKDSIKQDTFVDYNLMAPMIELQDSTTAQVPSEDEPTNMVELHHFFKHCALTNATYQEKVHEERLSKHRQHERRRAKVKRTREAMVGRLGTVLHDAGKVVGVEPHYDPHNRAKELSGTIDAWTTAFTSLMDTEVRQVDAEVAVAQEELELFSCDSEPQGMDLTKKALPRPGLVKVAAAEVHAPKSGVQERVEKYKVVEAKKERAPQRPRALAGSGYAISSVQPPSSTKDEEAALDPLPAPRGRPCDNELGRRSSTRVKDTTSKQALSKKASGVGTPKPQPLNATKVLVVLALLFVLLLLYEHYSA